MKCQVGDEHAPGANPLQDFRGEVQPGRRCGNRAALPRKDGLVTLTIKILILTANVRRQRNMSQKIQAGEEVVHRREAKQTFTEFAVSRDSGLEEWSSIGRRKGQLLPHRHPARRAGQRPPFPFVDLLGEQHFHLSGAAFSLTHAKQPRRDHAAVVQHQHIAWGQQLRQLVKPRVLPCSALPAQSEHAAAPAFGGRLLRDQLWRKLEVEIGDQHRSDCMKAAIRGYPQGSEWRS